MRPISVALHPGDAISRIRRDVERNALRARNGIKMVRRVDPPHLAPTPKDVVWSRGRAELWRYRGEDIRVGPPLLIVYSLMSRSYLLDLQPGNSFVQRLLDAGFDVFMLDWGESDERDASNVIEDYIEGYMPEALDAVREASGNPEMNLLGYCFGGVLSILYGARYPDAPVRSLTTIATPIDFSDVPLFSNLLKPGGVKIDDFFDETGNLPGKAFVDGFRILTPAADIGNYVTLFENIWNDEYVYGYQALGNWIRDQPPIPGGVIRQMVDMLMRENALVTDRVRLGGRRVPMTDFRWPLLGVIADRDLIVPKQMSEPILDVVASTEKDMLHLEGGHVGLVVGRNAHKVTIPTILEFLHRRSEPVASDASSPSRPP